MREFARLTASFTCYSLVVLLMNQALFPLYDTVFTYSRDISITFSSVILIAGALIAMRIPQSFDSKKLLGIGIAVVLAGAALVPVALNTGSIPLLLVGACLASTGRIWGTMNVCLAAVDSASRIPHGWVLASAPAGYCLSAGLDILLVKLPSPILLALVVLVLPLAMLALGHTGSRRNLDDLAKSVPAADLSVTRPASFLPLTSSFYIFQFIAFMAFGFALRFGEVDGSPVSSQALSLIGQAILLVCVLAMRGRLRYDGLCSLVVLVLLAGFFFVVSDVHGGAYVANSVLMVGNSLYNVLVLCTLVSLAQRNHLNSMAVFGWSNGLAGLGTTLGATVGVIVNRLLDSGYHEIAVYLVVAVALCLVAYVLFVLRGFSFDEAIEGVVAEEAPEPVVEADFSDTSNTVLDAEATFLARCHTLAVEHGLTPREEETFAMLARGRNREYIEEHLMVSRNTVKAHVKHVYAKLDVHSHQELLDKVESGK